MAVLDATACTLVGREVAVKSREVGKVGVCAPSLAQGRRSRQLLLWQPSRALQGSVQGRHAGGHLCDEGPLSGLDAEEVPHEAVKGRRVAPAQGLGGLGDLPDDAQVAALFDP